MSEPTLTRKQWKAALAEQGLVIVPAAHPADSAEALLREAYGQLERLTAIIEGRDERAKLVAPHGQTSAAPRGIMQKIDRYLRGATDE